MMNYRGEDLDLRTPQTWNAPPADAGAADPLRGRPMLQQGIGRSGPIWVDEIVLAACNHAFDVALAHRSAEVRLEHLLHALTRIDPAADVLEANGVRVGPLRRDTATVIASEIPIGLTNGKTMPRRSDELEDVLRAASGAASRHNAPANVEDVLAALANAMPEIQALQTVNRQPARASTSYAEGTSTMARNPYTFDPVEPRYRGYAAPQAEPAPRALRSDYAATPVDSVQNSRLDALEHMVRAIGSDVQSERRVFNTVLTDLQGEIGEHRNATAQVLAGGGGDRISAALSERLQSLENAVINIRPQTPELTPVFDRLSALEKSLQSGLQTLVSRAAAGGVDLSPIINRLDIIEEAVLSRDDPAAASLSDRLDELSSQLAADRKHTEETQASLLADFSSRFDRQKSEIAVAILTPLTDRVNTLTAAIEGRDDDVARDFAGISERIQALEAASATDAKTIADMIQHSTKAATDLQAAHAQELAEVHDALMKLNSNQHTLSGSIEQWRRDGQSSLTTLTERIDGVGTSVGGFATRLAGLEQEAGKPVQMLEALSSTVDNMHRVTVQRYYRRNRFWYWLFGTDDWVAASWPSQAQRIADDLTAVKSAPSKAA